MQYTSRYCSPLGEILIAADEIGLIGLWFKGQKYFAASLETPFIEKELPILNKAKHWLDIYFSGRDPDFTLKIHLTGTPFQNEVWKILCSIPYGQTITYMKIAQMIAQRRGIKHMSAQAVGSAVSRNKISIIIPCHRVVGTSGNLTGYAGGLDKKIELLKQEGAFQNRFFTVLPEL